MGFKSLTVLKNKVDYMGEIYDRVLESVGYIRPRIGENKQGLLFVVLGSSQGGCIVFDRPEDVLTFPYFDIPGFPPIRGHQVSGHAKEFQYGTIEGYPVLVGNGRYHYHEGYPGQELVHPVRVARELGAHTAILTNAAGGINPQFNVGDLMFIRHHLTLLMPDGANPLKPHDTQFGSNPHLNQLEVYSRSHIGVMEQAARECNIPYRVGVYAMVPGPQFESPPDVSMLRLAGVDAVGMSTVPEAMAAHQAGMIVLGISGITNVMKGDENPTTDVEVKEQSRLIGPRVNQLIHTLIPMLYHWH